MALDVSIIEKESGVFVAAPKGEINTETYQLFEERLKDIVPKAKAVVFEMGQVSYISSMGLSALFRVKLAVEERAGTIALVNMQPQVKQVFDTMKILSPQMFASLTEADEYLDKFLDGVQKGNIKPPERFA
ncbi:MAG: STAS domain-containing protein [Candidatus Omnitrophica bacterium]|nr:STAS domain-containing protein [Candidatus Omnitrophota bacterium]MDD4941730.1 STAS domain-containing protein [Candidatus Omnitrophota bacterium]MDD5774683.1 STAS domain-containing protein [Candidatus Omnitrophota bacterium]HNQ51052.1 STAS domain-containing protein [Candidatus Omnitrophota bacterium]HQO38619.1 STAS domain-containing protein [Candidatus Omnitrophota bacterium]